MINNFAFISFVFKKKILMNWKPDKKAHTALLLLILFPLGRYMAGLEPSEKKQLVEPFRKDYKEDYLFNVVAIFYQTRASARNQERGGNRAELVLKGQDLFYRMSPQIDSLHCGHITFSEWAISKILLYWPATDKNWNVNSDYTPATAFNLTRLYARRAQTNIPPASFKILALDWRVDTTWPMLSTAIIWPPPLVCTHMRK